MFTQFCRGPQVVIGSSMGGWMALLLARELAARVAARGFARRPRADRAGAGFHGTADVERLCARGARGDHDQGRLASALAIWRRPYPITRALIEEGRNHLLLGSAIEIGCPVRILQGAQDPDVPWQHAFALAQRLPSEDVVLTMIQDGDHRLSRPQDIARIMAAVAEIG